MQITLIGDIHGNVDEYNRIVRKHPLTLQLGDFGFEDTYKRINADSRFHKIIGGNHDAYNKLEDGSFNQPDNFLGDYGMWNEIFYVRGANSCDKAGRTVGVDWWPDEELSFKQLSEAIEIFGMFKPDIVATHDCPQFICENYFNIHALSKTRCALEEMFKAHQPKQWFFGHHHVTADILHGDCYFHCINELQTFKVIL